MKCVKEEILIDHGDFQEREVWGDLDQQVKEAIQAIKWPSGNDRFVIHPETDDDKHPNGVSPIKDAFLEKLKGHGWDTETRLDIAVHKQPGPIDVTYELDSSRHVAVEWETGNISSSHRAINKMCVGLLEEKLRAGALVVPSKKLYPHLTDRVGNYPELVPYFSVWRNLQVPRGVLKIYVVEQDGLDESVPKIEKGTDGRALV